MKTSTLETKRQKIAGSAFDDATRSSCCPKYNERLIAVEHLEGHGKLVLIFKSDHGNEFDRGIRTVVLKAKWVGSPGKVMLVVESSTFIRTDYTPTSSRRGGSTQFWAG